MIEGLVRVQREGWHYGSIPALTDALTSADAAMPNQNQDLHGNAPDKADAALLIIDVLKPKHSGFYNTTLPLLLEYLDVTKVIITGIATDNCVLFTASDAYMRDLEVVVPRDCVAAIDPRRHEYALEQMRHALKADTSLSTELDLQALAHVPPGGVEQSVG